MEVTTTNTHTPTTNKVRRSVGGGKTPKGEEEGMGGERGAKRENEKEKQRNLFCVELFSAKMPARQPCLGKKALVCWSFLHTCDLDS